MSDGVQTTMWPELAPERLLTRAVAAEGSITVPRQPGWVLVASKQGPQGWHLLQTQGLLGEILTVCHRVGRVISENERMIVLCPDCVAVAQAASAPR